MKRYLVFVGSAKKPGEGFADFVDDADTLEAAREILKKATAVFDKVDYPVEVYRQIYDTKTRSAVA